MGNRKNNGDGSVYWVPTRIEKASDWFLVSYCPGGA